MSTPAWLQAHADASPRHPAAPAGAAATTPRRSPRPSGHARVPWPASLEQPQFADAAAEQRHLYGGGGAARGTPAAAAPAPRPSSPVDELAFGAPGLAEALVHREQAAREEAEALLEEEVNRPLVSQRSPAAAADAVRAAWAERAVRAAAGADRAPAAPAARRG